jgi:hypothetical protein
MKKRIKKNEEDKRQKTEEKKMQRGVERRKNGAHPYFSRRAGIKELAHHTTVPHTSIAIDSQKKKSSPHTSTSSCALAVPERQPHK